MLEPVAQGLVDQQAVDQTARLLGAIAVVVGRELDALNVEEKESAALGTALCGIRS